LEQVQVRLGTELVVKSIRDGYDGKGQWVLGRDSNTDIPDSVYGNIIAERKIDFSRELSLVGARFPDGQCRFYPLVENYHQSGMLRYTLAPARDCGPLQEEAENMLRTVMESLGYRGVMAMECFDSEFGLMVNELAPRVHNSGHWTQAGADFNQFDLHLFAILGHAVRSPERVTPYSMMLNLIGCEWNNEWYSLPGIQCWWYGKSWRENRKLGHINLSGESIPALIETGNRLMPTLDEFHRQMLDLATQNLNSN
ncbi:MAG: ATP-grasp domain-containing protein, partial [bacterium]